MPRPTWVPDGFYRFKKKLQCLIYTAACLMRAFTVWNTMMLALFCSPPYKHNLFVLSHIECQDLLLRAESLSYLVCSQSRTSLVLLAEHSQPDLISLLSLPIQRQRNVPYPCLPTSEHNSRNKNSRQQTAEKHILEQKRNC